MEPNFKGKDNLFFPSVFISQYVANSNNTPSSLRPKVKYQETHLFHKHGLSTSHMTGTGKRQAMKTNTKWLQFS